jgi:hypothetical protein
MHLASQGINICESAIKVWKMDKYVKKDSIRINFSHERITLLQNIKDALIVLVI